MRDANYEREAGDEEDGEVLFPGAAGGDDRDLIDLAEAAAIAGCSAEEFLAGVQARMFPECQNFREPNKHYVFDGVRPGGGRRWRHAKLWRRGEVIAAMEKISRRVAPMFDPQRKDMRR